MRYVLAVLRQLPAWANLILILLASNLVASSASAVCFTWNSPPTLTLVQSNSFQVSIKNIQPKGIYISGNANSRDNNTGDTLHGTVVGTMGRSELQMEIKWDGGGHSIYTISFDEAGTITGGKAFEVGNPGKTFSFSSGDKFTCAEHPQTTTNPPPGADAGQAEAKAGQVLPGSTTGKGGGFIQMFPTLAIREDLDIHAGPGGDTKVIGIARGNTAAALIDKNADGWCKFASLPADPGPPQFAGGDGWVWLGDVCKP